MRNIGNKVLDQTFEIANPVLAANKARLAEITAQTKESIMDKFTEDKLKEIFNEGPSKLDSLVSPVPSKTISDESLITDSKEVDQP